MNVYGKLEDFFDANKDTVFRIWKKDEPEGSMCEFVYITAIISTRDDFLIEYVDSEDKKECKYKNYDKYSNLTFAISKGDQAENTRYY